MTTATSRRRFLKIAGISALAAPLYGKNVIGANETVRVAMIGCGNRGRSLAGRFGALKNVSIVAVCDPDTERMASLAKKISKSGDGKTRRPDEIRDYRKLLERKDIDAVVVASPNYWHALHAISAMAAGKDVYVEKPVTWDLWESRQLLAAEKKYDRIVCAGLQNRSDPGPRDGFQFVRDGHLGKILSVQVCCFRNRHSIGKRTTPLKPPASVDYNLWLGPAADLPMFRERFHYDWHWVWNTGNGDVGNQAPHEIDLCGWLLDASAHPATMRTFGNRFAWNDAGQTPNLLASFYELSGVPCTIIVNDLTLGPKRNVPGLYDGIRVGLVVHCEGGMLRGGRGGTYAVAPDGKTKIKKFPGDGGKLHQQRFIDTIRSRRRQDLPVQLSEAALAADIAHLANISHRNGTPGDAKAVQSAFGTGEPTETLLAYQAKQLAAWGIEKPAYQIGKPVQADPATARILTHDITPEFIHRNYRKEFTVPDLAGA